MLPREMPVPRHGPVVLRPFEETDIDVVLEVADDPLVPLMTTVPTSGTMADARATSNASMNDCGREVPTPSPSPMPGPTRLWA